MSTGAGTAEGCGRFSSAPAAGEEAADARLQGVTGAVTPEREESADGSAAYTFYNAVITTSLSLSLFS